MGKTWSPLRNPIGVGFSDETKDGVKCTATWMDGRCLRYTESWIEGDHQVIHHTFIRFPFGFSFCKDDSVPREAENELWVDHSVGRVRMGGHMSQVLSDIIGDLGSEEVPHG